MPEAVLGLGGNLGARRAIFRAAIALLDASPGCRVLTRSKLYETPPLGPPQPDYLNAAVRVSFAGEIDALLALTQRIQAVLGRERRVRWGARSLDIDVLYWSAGAVRTAALQVPHAELESRAFALAPLLDVAPELTVDLGSALQALGGPPPLAEPGWPELRREGDHVCSGWQREDAELASSWIELMAASAQVTERCDAAIGQKGKLSSHTFTGPSELFDADGRCWLSAVVNDALARGFAVQMGAVLSRDETHSAGVLLGFDGCEPAVLGPLSLSLEPGEPPMRRVKMREDAPGSA